jgi:hypothetical protein
MTWCAIWIGRWGRRPGPASGSRPDQPGGFITAEVGGGPAPLPGSRLTVRPDHAMGGDEQGRRRPSHRLADQAGAPGRAHRGGQASIRAGGAVRDARGPGERPLLKGGHPGIHQGPVDVADGGGEGQRQQVFEPIRRRRRRHRSSEPPGGRTVGKLGRHQRPLGKDGDQPADRRRPDGGSPIPVGVGDPENHKIPPGGGQAPSAARTQPSWSTHNSWVWSVERFRS